MASPGPDARSADAAAGAAVGATTQMRRAHARLRADLLDGVLRPGEKLNIAALADALGVSPGAVREALARLESETLVESEPQRGFRASPLSAREFDELVRARASIDALCLAEAIAHGDVEWETGIVAAFHRLSKLPMLDPSDRRRPNAAWSAAHAAFHAALVASCPNRWLLRMQRMLFQHAERYRRLAGPAAERDRDVGAEHRALMEAALARDERRALELLRRHLEATGDAVRAAMDTPPARARGRRRADGAARA